MGSYGPALIFASLILGSPLFAQEEIPYDRYAAIWREGPLKEEPSKAAETFTTLGKHFLVYPFELVRWPLDKTLIFVEDYHIDDKIDWILEQLKDRGITPRIRGIATGDSFGGGVDIEFVKLLMLKDRFPHTTVEGRGFWTVDGITEYRAKILQSDLFETGLRAGGNFKYEDRSEEHFYGIGPDTSVGDDTSYRMERTTLETILGYSFLNTWDLEGKFAFQNVNITKGQDKEDGRETIDQIFIVTGRQDIPGRWGDRILSWGLSLEHDNRDSEDVPTQGGFQRFHFGFHKGMDNDTGYFKYRGEAGHFFKIFSKRRVLGLRGVVEHHDEVGDRRVPFFDMSRLGGYGTYPRYGDTHRGYVRDRFYDESLMLFNVEYRWTAWEYREIRMDPVVFTDVGQVFGEWSDFQFKDFRTSYGLGFRVSVEKEVFFTFEVARSSEGTQFYVKTKTPF
jgi:hypothetical protein